MPPADPEQRRRDKQRAAKRGGASGAVPIGKGSHGRIRTTNRALEARQFSTVRVPRSAEVKTANERGLAPELRAGEAGRKALADQQRSKAQSKAEKLQRDTKRAATATSTFEGIDASAPIGADTTTKRAGAAAAGTSGSHGFDPIPGDATFTIVENSRYWPPKPLDKATLAKAGAGAMDQFDRRDDEAAAKRAKVKAAAGEIRHPRGRQPKNAKVTFDDDEEGASD
uniref:Uncharacterized protein n=1 Tax=Neobodo designis TaxID=312471 RepID=A0A7S1M5M6_NEODS|mmetsp:Transcript_34376/g.106207  ORF Transcript_34376/g.106207 Transcript_34376/m.106207 type:complete len:226 (+) Transcript_34376:61-738(+)